VDQRALQTPSRSAQGFLTHFQSKSKWCVETTATLVSDPAENGLRA
jgi:hypothetical protein